MEVVSTLDDIAAGQPAIVFSKQTEATSLLARRLSPIFASYVLLSQKTMFQVDGTWEEEVGDVPLLNTLTSKYPLLLPTYTVPSIKQQPPPFTIQTPDAVKFVRDVYPSIDLVVFLPGQKLFLATQPPAALRRGIWPSVEELADAVASVLAVAPPAVMERIMVLPSHDNMPPIGCLNFVTGQSYAFADLVSTPRPLGDSETNRILRYSGLLQSSSLADAVDVLKQTVELGMEAGLLSADAFRHYESTNNVFGAVQIMSALSTAQFDGRINTPAAATPHPWLNRITFADVCQILYGMEDGVSSPLVETVWYVYGRYDASALDASYPGKGLQPCPHTIAAVNALKTAGQTYFVTEVASAADVGVPPEKQEGHDTVPVVFRRVGDGPLLFVGGRDSLEAALLYP